MTPKTLAEQGYRMPAEWESHAATWLSWPHKEASWPGKLELIPPIFAQMVRHLAEGEGIHINVGKPSQQEAIAATLKAHKADASNVRIHPIPTNDSWVRDHGPIFVKNPAAERPLVATNWGYNAWGGKYPPFDLDDEVPVHAARVLGVPVVNGNMILEGGSIDVNGEGLLLTTEACLLNPNRNPHLSRAQIEARLRDLLGVREVLWLGDGIVGDDTDGHVDDLTRFVAPRTVVTVVESDSSDENYRALQENHERLAGMRTADGGALDVIELPMPDPIENDGMRLPASYANFYIGNAAVLVPVFDCPRKDEQALGILRELFPGRRVVGIRSVDLVWGLGAFHCLTQQQPAV